ncbi:uncharacterized protein LOC113208685 [Frankliniella occidentalis]|uniref:Uncharacterized protein LOC113208685 n=1 Tax=Frankliniella occidentalis TaxID=133901 RepID=A0A9C6U3U4_FRAOC|nr:uncharacterized protein LOC113208685 [Frankliniella occidentalis]
MNVRLHRALWVARVLTVALGLVVVGALLHLQRGRPVAGLLSEAVEPPPGAEREGRPWLEERRPAVPDDEGVVEADRASEERAGQQEAALSLARIARLLGWGGHDHDDIEEEHDEDRYRIRIKDWRPLEELGALQWPARGGGGPDADGQTTEWADNALLRAFIARFGSVHTTGGPPAPPLDLEMTDFPSASVTSPTSAAAVPVSVSQASTGGL